MPAKFIRSVPAPRPQLLLLLAVIAMLAQADGTSFVQIGDTAGLPYAEVQQSGVFLKEAYMDFQTHSSWKREVAGFEPFHAVEMNMNSRFILQNDGDDAVDLPIRLPLMTSLESESLSLVFNSDEINYTSIEYANPRDASTGLQLYTLDLTVPPGTNVMEVDATSTGAAGIEVDFTVMMKDASRWPKPIETLVVSSMHENGLITGYSIQPSRTTLKAATWEFDEAPSQDLTLRWRITEPPVGGGIDTEKIRPTDPLIPPIIAIVVGGALIGFIAYIRLKRRAQGKAERQLGQ